MIGYILSGEEAYVFFFLRKVFFSLKVIGNPGLSREMGEGVGILLHKTDPEQFNCTSFSRKKNLSPRIFS